MLSKQLRKKLVFLFQFMGQIEKQVEVLREVLCGQTIFEPYILFRSLDKNHKGYICAKDLQYFFQNNDKDYALEDLDILIKQLSQRSDNQWRYTDFMHIVLTTENVKLRSIVTQRPTYDVKASPLPYDVTFGFLRIIEKEMEQLVKLNTLKYELQKTQDFDIKKIFDTIDTYGTGQILHDQLGIFLLNNQIGTIGESSLQDYIFRRLDANRDNQVDIEDLKISLEVNEELMVIPKEQQTILMDKTNQTNRTRLNDKTSKNQSYIQSDNVLQQNQKLEYPNRRSMVSVTKHVVKMRNANLNRSPGNNKNQQQNLHSINDELIYLVECLRIFTKLEYECEQLRERLAQQDDFNVLDIFEAFNIDQTAKLCPSDIGSALEQLNMYPNQTQLFLWVKRYDKDHDGKLNVREFVQSLIPFNEILKKKISQRPQRILNATYQQRSTNNDSLYQLQQGSFKKKYTPQYLKNFLCSDTLQLVCQCIKAQIENEVAIEAVRQRVCKRPNFDLKKLFNILDSNSDGLISKDDLRRIMEDYGIIFQDQELNLLKNRFDKNDDSMISYAEFIAEIYPKTKHKL